MFQLHCKNRPTGPFDDDETVAQEECVVHDGEICFGEIEYCLASHLDGAG